MGPFHYCSPTPPRQGLPSRCPRPHGCRRCLLKGCERWFVPSRPQARYCSSDCQQAARRWRRWRAAQCYRATEKGKQRRREQSKRYRQQQRQARAARVQPPREGQRPDDFPQPFSGCCCARPGCYERFVPSPRSPEQRFCSSACRQALRRVRQRDVRRQAAPPRAPPRSGCLAERRRTALLDVVAYFLSRCPVLACPCPQEQRRQRAGVIAPARDFLCPTRGRREGLRMSDWEPGAMRALPVAAFGERYRRYRLPDAQAETAMALSLQRYGQMAPLVVCLREETPEVIDGFKRLIAARTLPATQVLNARLLAADERSAKAAIYGLNHASRRTQELEEAWIVSALVREDGLSQPETAELLGRHKSWVCRRLALVERLAEEARGAARGSADADGGAVAGAVARGQPSRGAGLRPPRGLDHGGAARRRRAAASGDRSDAAGARAGPAAPGAGAGAGRRRPRSRRAAERRRQPCGAPSGCVARTPGADGALAASGWASRADGGGRRAAGRAFRPAGRRRGCGGDFGRRSLPGAATAMNEAMRNEIMRRWQAGASGRAIARQLGLSRNTVRRALAQVQAARAGQTPAPPPRRASLLDAYEADVQDLLERYPDMTATRVFEELCGRGFTGGYTIVRARLEQLRPCRARAGGAFRDGPGGAGTNGLRDVHDRFYRGRASPRPPVQLSAGLLAPAVPPLRRGAGPGDDAAPSTSAPSRTWAAQRPRACTTISRWWCSATRTMARCTTRVSWPSPRTTASGQWLAGRGGRRPRARWSGRSTTPRPTCSTGGRSARWRTSTR